jgi:hypothetical protein
MLLGPFIAMAWMFYGLGWFCWLVLRWSGWLYWQLGRLCWLGGVAGWQLARAHWPSRSRT